MYLLEDVKEFASASGMEVSTVEQKVYSIVRDEEGTENHPVLYLPG
jgi:hypothetical protein